MTSAVPIVTPEKCCPIIAGNALHGRWTSVPRMLTLLLWPELTIHIIYTPPHLNNRENALQRTCMEAHSKPLYGRLCEDFRIQNNWKRVGRRRTIDFLLPVGSFESREPIAASDSAADAD